MVTVNVFAADGTQGGFPSQYNTGASVSAPITSVNVPSGATSGTGWTWNAGTTTVTATGNVSALNITGNLVVSGASATVSNCAVSGTLTVSGAGVTMSACSVAGQTNLNVSNVTLSGCTFPTEGVILANGSANITTTLITNCVILGTPASSGVLKLGGGTFFATNTTVQSCTVGGIDNSANRADYGIYDPYGTAVNTVVSQCQVSNARLCVQIESGIIENCYLSCDGFQTGDHNECIYVNGGTTGLTISGNTLLNPFSQTAALYMFSNANPGTNHGITITGNLFAGGDYAIYAGDTNTRADAASGLSGTTLTDTHLVSTDVGANISGTGIPNGTTILSVTGSTATLSASCTTGTVTVTLHYTTGLEFTNNAFSTMYYPTSGDFGPVTDVNQYGTGNVWSGNYWYDGVNAGQAVPV